MFGKSEHRSYEVCFMNCTFVKVLLYAYPRLRELAESVSAAVENKALLSFRSYGNALDCAEKIVEEIILGRNLESAADAVDKALKNLSEEELYFLEYKYFRRKRVLGERFGGFQSACSERSYYRKQAGLLKRIAFLLAALGWTEQRFFEAFGASFFMKLYRALEAGREQTITAKRTVGGLSFQKSTCSSECAMGGFLPRSTKNATAMHDAHTMQMTAISTPESPPPEAGLFSGLPPAEAGTR